MIPTRYQPYFPEGRTFYLDATKLYDIEERAGRTPSTTWQAFLQPFLPSIQQNFNMPWAHRSPTFVVVVSDAREFMVELLATQGVVAYAFTQENFEKICEPESVGKVHRIPYHSHLFYTAHFFHNR